MDIRKLSKMVTKEESIDSLKKTTIHSDHEMSEDEINRSEMAKLAATKLMQSGARGVILDVIHKENKSHTLINLAPQQDMLNHIIKIFWLLDPIHQLIFLKELHDKSEKLHESFGK